MTDDPFNHVPVVELFQHFMISILLQYSIYRLRQQLQQGGNPASFWPLLNGVNTKLGNEVKVWSTSFILSSQGYVR